MFYWWKGCSGRLMPAHGNLLNNSVKMEASMHMKDRCERCWEEQYFLTRPGTNSSVEGNLFSPPTECSPEPPFFPTFGQDGRTSSPTKCPSKSLPGVSLRYFLHKGAPPNQDL